MRYTMDKQTRSATHKSRRHSAIESTMLRRRMLGLKLFVAGESLGQTVSYFLIGEKPFCKDQPQLLRC